MHAQDIYAWPSIRITLEILTLNSILSYREKPENSEDATTNSSRLHHTTIGPAYVDFACPS